MALVTTAATLAACASSNVDDDSSEPYRGKRIEIIVPVSAGGGADLTARAIAPLLQKYIAGEPPVTVVNHTGAGGVTGTNFFATQAPQDGRALLLSSGSSQTAFAVRAPEVEYDFKDMNVLLGVASSAMVYVRSDTGIKQPADIVKPTAKPLVFCGQAPTGADLIKLLALDLLKVNYEALFGFEGASDANIAFQRGECNIAVNSVLPYRQQILSEVEKGNVIPIMQTGLSFGGEVTRLESLPDAMTPPELYREIYGSDPSGEAWSAYNTLAVAADSLSKAIWVPKAAPDNVLTTLRDAISEILNTPEAYQQLEASLEGSEPIPPGDELNSAVDAIVNADSKSTEWLQKYLSDRWDVDSSGK